ncbi:hypothetical protein BD410DRAFT_724617 [Rickenella mellea]|uniref:Polysaccharide lyase 14 domain-containing protein n=1 Tax=Rickenella mellea TaxID=50990 RepID=A0A4Y7Q0X9_9AGAM|nr:hypothetical protein BD410DRAFT_724617 [Rickenella mellea]
MSLQRKLFPHGYKYITGFTTASCDTIPGVTSVELSDAALNVTKITSGITHNIVSQKGKTAWEAIYPEGSYNPSALPRGGFGFYLGGSEDFQSAIQAGASHVIFSYSIMFQDGFQWNKGGKLPGGFGGIGDLAYACSGGRQTDRAQCFDFRLMWRTNGTGELYAYVPLTDDNANILSIVPPLSILNTDYGWSVGRGAWTFPSGEWVTVAERIKLSDPYEANGEVEVWFNGESVINVQGLELRNDTSSIVQGMHFQTFFGGSTVDWASPVNQTAWFADVSGAAVV